MKQLVSFVIPCYRSAQTIGRVVREIDETMAVLAAYQHEIILVNDASPDDALEKIRELCKERKDICGVNLARNFGQHAALMAGFGHVQRRMWCMQNMYTNSIPFSAISAARSMS